MDYTNKELERSGIYLIKSTFDDRCYVGSAVNLYERRRGHKFQLRHNKHENSKLQNFYNKYGEDYLTYVVLEFCDKNKLVEREQYYLDTVKPSFNIYAKAYSPIGHKATEETRKKLSESIRNSVKHKEAAKRNGALRKGVFKVSDETKAILSAKAKLRRWPQEHKDRLSAKFKGRVSPTKGTKLTPEHIEKLRIASTGKKHTEEAKRKISETHRGRVFTLEHRQNISKARKGIKLSDARREEMSTAAEKCWTNERKKKHKEFMEQYHQKRRDEKVSRLLAPLLDEYADTYNDFSDFTFTFE